MRKTTISGLGVVVLEGALAVSGYQNVYVAGGLAILGISLFMPLFLDIAKRWGRNGIEFERLLATGEALLTEGQIVNLQATPWTSRVINWDQDARKLIHKHGTETDLSMYRNMGQNPEQGQDVGIILETLKRRREKLRAVMGRYLDGDN